MNAECFFLCIQNIYMDDILWGGHTLQEAMTSKKQTKALLMAGGFEQAG